MMIFHFNIPNNHLVKRVIEQWATLELYLRCGHVSSYPMDYIHNMTRWEKIDFIQSFECDKCEVEFKEMAEFLHINQK